MTTRRIRVLVVDDAVVVRKLVTDILAADPALEVCGVASSGEAALAKLPELAPDIVTLDIEMPGLGGLETLSILRERCPLLPVIIFSTMTERGAATALEALARGASDYVSKPSNTRSFVVAMDRVRAELLPKIKTLCRPREQDRASSSATATVPPPLPDRPGSLGTTPVSIMVVGCSTGGPTALEAVLADLPADLRVPVVIVQHMPPMFTRLLAERLDLKCSLAISEAQHGEPLVAGHAYIAPGNFHLTVHRSPHKAWLETHQDPPENSCRPAVDVLFRSAADAYEGSVLAVVMTGMGQDGLRGCQALAIHGAQIVVQDEATSVVWGMPGYIADADLADRVLPLSEIGPELVRRVRAGRPRERARPRT